MGSLHIITLLKNVVSNVMMSDKSSFMI